MGKICLIFLLVVACSDVTENSFSVSTDNPTIAGRAMDNGLIDVRLNKVTRYYHPSGNHMDWLSVKPTWPIILDGVKGYTGISVSGGDRHTGYANEGDSWYTIEESPSNYGKLPSNGFHFLWGLSKNINGKLDHMTSRSSNEGGYNPDFILGAVFNSSVPTLGLAPMRRYSKSWNDGSPKLNHMTAKLNGYPSGYSYEGVLGYAWPINFSWGWNGENDRKYIRNGNISIGSSKGWGGAITSLKWHYRDKYDGNKNKSVELINWTPGRALQSAIFYGRDATYNDNPTEQGDAYGNGSISLGYSASGNELKTHCNALQFNAPNFTSNNKYHAQHPILTGTEIRKNVKILNGNIVKYQVSMDLAKGVMNRSFIAHEVLAIHLVPGIFDRYKVYQFSRNKWNNLLWKNSNKLASSGAISVPDKRSPVLSIYGNYYNKSRAPKMLKGLVFGMLILDPGQTYGEPEFSHINVNTSDTLYKGSNGPRAWTTVKMNYATYHNSNHVYYKPGQTANYLAYLIVASNESDLFRKSKAIIDNPTKY